MTKNDIIKQQWGYYTGFYKGAPIEKISGYDYGDPDHEKTYDVSTGTTNGNYKKIKDELLLPFLKNKTIVEIGSFDGKWVQFFKEAKRIICVDLFKDGFERMKKRWEWDNLEFYLTNGDELRGIKDDSVDIIFSIDSLVRADKEVIREYLKEFKRVLVKNGKICVHLPCDCSVKSVAKGFTNLGEDEIVLYCNELEFKNYEINKIIITHGVLLLVNYNQS